MANSVYTVGKMPTTGQTKQSAGMKRAPKSAVQVEANPELIAKLKSKQADMAELAEQIATQSTEAFKGNSKGLKALNAARNGDMQTFMRHTKTPHNVELKAAQTQDLSSLGKLTRGFIDNSVDNKYLSDMDGPNFIEQLETEPHTFGQCDPKKVTDLLRKEATLKEELEMLRNEIDADKQQRLEAALAEPEVAPEVSVEPEMEMEATKEVAEEELDQNLAPEAELEADLAEQEIPMLDDVVLEEDIEKVVNGTQAMDENDRIEPTLGDLKGVHDFDPEQHLSTAADLDEQIALNAAREASLAPEQEVVPEVAVEVEPETAPLVEENVKVAEPEVEFDESIHASTRADIDEQLKLQEQAEARTQAAKQEAVATHKVVREAEVPDEMVIQASGLGVKLDATSDVGLQGAKVETKLETPSLNAAELKGDEKQGLKDRFKQRMETFKAKAAGMVATHAIPGAGLLAAMRSKFNKPEPEMEKCLEQADTDIQESFASAMQKGREDANRQGEPELPPLMEVEEVPRLSRMEELQAELRSNKASLDEKINASYNNPDQARAALRALGKQDIEAFRAQTTPAEDPKLRSALHGYAEIKEISKEIRERDPDLSTEFTMLMLKDEAEERGVDLKSVYRTDEAYAKANAGYKQLAQEPETLGGGIKEGVEKEGLGESMLENIKRERAIMKEMTNIRKQERETAKSLQPELQQEVPEFEIPTTINVNDPVYGDNVVDLRDVPTLTEVSQEHSVGHIEPLESIADVTSIEQARAARREQGGAISRGFEQALEKANQPSKEANKIELDFGGGRERTR